MSKQTNKTIKDLEKLMGRKFEKVDAPRVTEKDLNTIDAIREMMKNANNY